MIFMIIIIKIMMMITQRIGIKFHNKNNNHHDHIIEFKLYD